MLAWVLVFLAVALIAALFGYTKIAVAAADIARVLFLIFVVLFVVSLIMYGIGVNFALLTWAIIFFVIAIVAGLLGFSGVAAVSSKMAKIIFFIFLVLFAVSLIMYFTGNQMPPVMPTPKS